LFHEGQDGYRAVDQFLSALDIERKSGIDLVLGLMKGL